MAHKLSYESYDKTKTVLVGPLPLTTSKKDCKLQFVTVRALDMTHKLWTIIDRPF